MTLKIKFTLLLFFFFTLSHSANAQSSSSSPGSILSPTQLTTPQEPELVARIKQAKTFLNAEKLNYALKPVYTKNKKTGKTVLSSYQLHLKDIALAIWDPASQSVVVTKAMQKGKSFTFPDKNFDIKLVRFNGVNSNFQVNKPEGGKVIALKYLITPTESGSKSKIENELYEAVYVPYSTYLDTPEVAAYGEKYLSDIIDQVAKELSTYASSVDSSKTIIEVIKPSLVRALVYAEHMDGYELAATPDPRNIISRINTLFAGNEGDTYRYSVSSAAARGISQFIPSTYEALVKRHVGANLIPDFEAGMSDHKNSIKATYLLLDDYIQAVKARTPQEFIEGQAFDFGVASYNGGVARVARALKAFGQSWNQDPTSIKNELKGQISALAASIETQRQATLAEKDKVKRAQKQTALDNARAELKLLKSRLADLEDSTLRAETIGYLQKIYKVIPFFNELHLVQENKLVETASAN